LAVFNEDINVVAKEKKGERAGLSLVSVLGQKVVRREEKLKTPWKGR